MYCSIAVNTYELQLSLTSPCTLSSSNETSTMKYSRIVHIYVQPNCSPFTYTVHPTTKHYATEAPFTVTGIFDCILTHHRLQHSAFLCLKEHHFYKDLYTIALLIDTQQALMGSHIINIVYQTTVCWFWINLPPPPAQLQT